jgi:hypothetical protein
MISDSTTARPQAKVSYTDRRIGGRRSGPWRHGIRCDEYNMGRLVNSTHRCGDPRGNPPRMTIPLPPPPPPPCRRRRPSPRPPPSPLSSSSPLPFVVLVIVLLLPPCTTALVSHQYGSSAMDVTIHGLIVVAKFLDVNGPRGTYSHFCTSCALQSFMSTYPNILPRAYSDAIGLPIAFVAFAFVVAPSVAVAGGSYASWTFVLPPTKNATSDSKSSIFVGRYALPALGFVGSDMTFPQGRRIVPPHIVAPSSSMSTKTTGRCNENRSIRTRCSRVRDSQSERVANCPAAHPPSPGTWSRRSWHAPMGWMDDFRSGTLSRNR